MPNRVVVLSGGVDSTVTLARVLNEPGPPVIALSFDYGQTHRVELASARDVAAYFSIPHEIIDVAGLLRGGSLLGEGEIPLGHYADESMKSTVVHARNMLFASLAVSRAGEGGEVWLGVHGGDHHIYPDCRPTFWEPYSEAVRAAYSVEIVTPYLSADKTEIARDSARFGAPVHLTWSCYQGGPLQCGACGTCVERREAFALAGVPDPTTYV